MANWFCSVFNVVCVVNSCPVHAVRSELIDSAWIVIVTGQKCIKKIKKLYHMSNVSNPVLYVQHDFSIIVTLGAIVLILTIVLSVY